MQIHRAHVAENRSLTPAVRHVSLRLVDAVPFSFRAGQFVQFVLDETTLRQYSIASVPRLLPVIELCADVSPGGRGSRFVEGLGVGDPVRFRGPFGVFTVPREESRPLEFVATGAGIAPIRAMIGAWADQGDASSPGVRLTFGNRLLADILYHEEWRSLAERSPVFSYCPTLSNPPQAWSGERGRVTEVLRRRTDLAGRAFFLCGAPAMVDDVRMALETFGVPEADIHFEKFL